MDKLERLFFIALLPPLEIQEYASRIKQRFAEVYNSRAALKSPPHITLQAPFKWQPEKLALLERELEEFAGTRGCIPVTLSNFGAFKPRVIYVNVLKSLELLAAQKELTTHLEKTLDIVDRVAKSRPFAPHLTVGFRDLTRQNFYKAWQEFEKQELYFEFTVPRLTLLFHNGKCWEIAKEFNFKDLQEVDNLNRAE